MQHVSLHGSKPHTLARCMQVLGAIYTYRGCVVMNMSLWLPKLLLQLCA